MGKNSDRIIWRLKGYSVLLVDQITDIGNEMCVFKHQDFQFFLSQIQQICIIFTHLKLSIALAKTLQVSKTLNKLHIAGYGLI